MIEFPETKSVSPVKIPDRMEGDLTILPEVFSVSQLDYAEPALAYIGNTLFVCSDAKMGRGIFYRDGANWQEVQNVPLGWVREVHACGDQIVALCHARGEEEGYLYKIDPTRKAFEKIESVEARRFRRGEVMRTDGYSVGVKSNNGEMTCVAPDGSFVDSGRTEGGCIHLSLQDGGLTLPKGVIVTDLCFNPSSTLFLITIRGGMKYLTFCVNRKGEPVGDRLKIHVSGKSQWLDDKTVLLLQENWPSRIPVSWTVTSNKIVRLIYNAEPGFASSLAVSKASIAFCWETAEQPRCIVEFPRCEPPPLQLIESSSRWGKTRTTIVKGPVGPIPCIIYEPRAEQVGTLLYLHGGPNEATWPTFSPLSLALAERGWKVISPNVRGSALTEPLIAPGMTNSYGDADLKDTICVAEHFFHENTVFMGMSYGGYLGARTADVYKFSKGYVLLSGFFMKADIATTLNSDTLRFYKTVFASDAYEPLPKAPCFIAHGDNDLRIPLESVLRHKNQLPEGSEVVIVPGEGHGISSDEAAVTIYPKLFDWLKNIVIQAPMK